MGIPGREAATCTWPAACHNGGLAGLILTEAAVADTAALPVHQPDLANHAIVPPNDREGKPVAAPPAAILAGQPDGRLSFIAGPSPVTGTGLNVGIGPKPAGRVLTVHRGQQPGHILHLPWPQQQSRRTALGCYTQ
jgi:hypothetical protein